MKRTLAILILLVTVWGAFCASGIAATSIFGTPSALPSTITFTASNPDIPTVFGNSAATITFRTQNGSNANTWQLQVQATTASFGGTCPSTVPASAVLVTCGSASVSAGGGTGTCGGSFNLSTTPQTVASGNEGTGAGASRPTYTVTLNFTFTDSWTYIPASCTLGLSYTINAP